MDSNTKKRKAPAQVDETPSKTQATPASVSNSPQVDDAPRPQKKPKRHVGNASINNEMGATSHFYVPPNIETQDDEPGSQAHAGSANVSVGKQTSQAKPAAAQPTKSRKTIVQKGPALDPNDYPVTIDPNLSLEAKYQALIQWRDFSLPKGKKMSFDKIRQLWIGKGYLATGKDNITPQALQKSYKNHYAIYYEEKGLEMPTMPTRKNKMDATTTGGHGADEDQQLLVAGHNKTTPSETPNNHIPIEEMGQNVSANRTHKRVLDDTTMSDIETDHDPDQESDDRPPKRHVPATATEKDQSRFWANRKGSHITFLMRDQDGNLINDPDRLIIDANAAAESSRVLNLLLQVDPSTTEVYTAYGESKEALGRLIQCISPNIRSCLPTHDIFVLEAESKTTTSTRIEWTTESLFELYKVAYKLEVPHVKDMIIDQFHKDYQTTKDLEISDQFLNWLAEHEEVEALNFWTDRLAAYKDSDYPDSSYWSDALLDAIQCKTYMEDGYPRSRLDNLHGAEYCHNYHTHGSEPCYKAISTYRLKCERSVEMAEFAIVLGLSDKLQAASDRRDSARWHRNQQGIVDAKASVRHIVALLKEAVSSYDIEWFLKRGRIVDHTGKFVMDTETETVLSEEELKSRKRILKMYAETRSYIMRL